MPVAGVTTPVTIEGFIAVSAAEHVATWLAGRAVNPDVRLGGSQWAGTIDMRTGAISYSCSDAMYYAFASIEFLRRWTGVSIPPGSGEYCDAKLPGLYAVLEKHYKAMTVAAFTGTHPSLGQGMLECGKTICAAQLMLERDLAGSLSALGRSIDPTPENLALDTIADIGLGLSRNHLQSEHTLRHFRDSLWLPELVDRSGWNGPETEAAALDRAQSRADELIAQYRKPEGREDKLRALRAVMERAGRELLG
jgi:trimethylamine--corrinoid protein Co-methyltransferase